MKIRLSKEASRTIKRFKRSLLSAAFFSLPLLCYAAIAITFIRTDLNPRMDLAVLTNFFQTRSPLPPPNDVVIVAIDDRTYHLLEASLKFPLHRRDIATAFERIEEARPRVMILDVKFPDERTIDPDADRRIAAAISKMPSTIWSGRSARNQSGEVFPSAEIFRKAARLELIMFKHGKFDSPLGSYSVFRFR